MNEEQFEVLTKLEELLDELESAIDFGLEDPIPLIERARELLKTARGLCR